MSLKIIDGDRIEDLAADLMGKLLADRSAGADPFVFMQVVVPNANVAKWLQMRVFAKERSLCAGVRFPFFEQLATELMRANLARPEVFELLPDHAYACAIMRILLSEGDEPSFRMSESDRRALAPFRTYIAGNGGGAPSVDNRKRAQMAWQLADKLASLMDTYEVRRPEIVADWLGKTAGGSGGSASHRAFGRVEAGEAALARALWGKDGVFPDDGNRLSLRQLYERVKASSPQGPARKLYFFGQSTLTLLQARILAWLARTHEVVLHYNNPCREYWGDIETAKERRKSLFGIRSQSGDQDPDLAFDWTVNGAAVENPLLVKFGIAGRETVRLLVDLEEEVGDSCGFIWESVSSSASADGRPTVLSRVQESIRKRTSEVGRLPQDASIQVVGAPGIRREVEMAYNSILGSVYRPKGVEGDRPWPDCTFSDIAVLVPDMKTYRPVIESVFDARGEVPYGLIDTSVSEDSRYLGGFLALMELARRGLSRETLFAVLENPCVQTALGFSRKDVVEWRELTEELGAFDGFERKDADDCFCWDWALSRLRLGRVADSLKVGVGDRDDLPLVMRNGAAAFRFSEIVELLYRELRAAFENEDGSFRRLPCATFGAAGGRERTACWAQVLERLAREFLAVPEDDRLEDGVRREIMRTLNGLGGFESTWTFELPVAAVEHFVGGVACRKGGYLTHGVTIAGLQPMRPVPFRQVYVLGAGAGGFPGRTGSSTLDVRGTGWRLGDVSLPNTNRYLFLETLMAVRDRLVLSYPNRDIEKDAELFPSGIVRELESFIGSSVLNDTNGAGERVGFLEFSGLPLLEHGESGLDAKSLAKSPVCAIAWNPTDKFAGILPTYSRAARRLARRRNGGGWDAPRQTREWKEEPPGASEYTAKELADFVRSPMRAVLRHRFGVAVESHSDRLLDPEPPLEMPSGPPLWDLQATWLNDFDAGIERPFRELQLAGGVPTGFLGEFAKSTAEARLAPQAADIRDFANRLREEDVAVLVSGNLGKDGEASTFPPDRVLEPLIAFVIDLARRADLSSRTLTVGVVDMTHGTCRSWCWKDITHDRASEYLAKLEADYGHYLKTGRAGGPVDVEYRKLTGAKSLGPYLAACKADASDGTRTVREELLRKIVQEVQDEVRRQDGESKFNNGLVIQKVVDGLVSEADAETLGDWIVGRYSLPLEGRMTDGPECGEAAANREGAAK